MPGTDTTLRVEKLSTRSEHFTSDMPKIADIRADISER